MKLAWLKNCIRIKRTVSINFLTSFLAIFLAMILAVLFCVRPLYNRVTNSIDDYRITLQNRLASTVSLGVSYKSLSPAILSVFRIKGVEIFDAESGRPILKIKQAVFSYNPIKLLRGDTEHAFSRLFVYGVTADYDAFRQSGAKKKLSALIAALPTGEQTVPELRFSLPFDVVVKAVEIHYGSSLADVNTTIQSLVIHSASGNFLEAEIAGHISVLPTEEGKALIPAPMQQFLDTLSGAFLVTGVVSPRVAGSSVSITVSSAGTSAVKINRFSLFAEYTGNAIRVSSLQSASPLNFEGEISVPFDMVRLRFRANEFKPFSVISVSGAPFVRNFRGTSLSGNYSVVISRARKTVDYFADGAFSLPDRLIEGGLTTSYQITGNPDILTIASLKIDSPAAELVGSGNINLKTMQPTGFVDIPRILLPNGNIISTEVYFDTATRGFVCFIPQLLLNDSFGARSLTALQLTVIPGERSADFTFEASDYSHYEFDSPGIISVTGSFLADPKPFLQASVSVENFFIDSGLMAALFFLQPEQVASLETAVRAATPFLLTNEMYISTDFASLSYNNPYSIIANTQKDRNFVIFAFDGSDTAFNLSRLDMRAANQQIRATLQADISPDYHDVFFVSDVDVNSIPYRFTGSIAPGASVSISGNYGFSANFFYPEDASGVYTASLKMQEFPIALNNFLGNSSNNSFSTVFGNSLSDSLGNSLGNSLSGSFAGKQLISLSTDLSMVYSENAGAVVTLSRIEASGMDNISGINPHLIMSGKADSAGMFLNSVAYSDAVSSLLGTGSLVWAISGGILDSATFMLNAANQFSGERYDIALNMSNPDRYEFSQTALVEYFHFSILCAVTASPVARFFENQKDGDVVSARLSFLGIPSDPLVIFQVDRASVSLASGPLTVQGNASFENNQIFVENAQASWHLNEIRDISAYFSLSDFSGYAEAFFRTTFGANTMSAPLSIRFENGDAANNVAPSGKSKFPGTYQISVSSSGFVSPVFPHPRPFEVDIVRQNGRFDFFSAKTNSLYGYFLDSGELSLTLSGILPIHFAMRGTVVNSQLDIDVRNISADMSQFSGLLVFPFFGVYKGHVTGDLHIGGLVSDPDFSGAIIGAKMEINVPNYVPAHLTSDLIVAEVTESTFAIMDTPLKSPLGALLLNLEIVLTGWRFDHANIGIKVPDKQFVPVVFTVPSVSVQVEANADLNIFASTDLVTVTGSAFSRNGVVSITPVGMDDDDTGRASSVDVRVELELIVGQRVQLLLSPLLRGEIAQIRGLVTPNTDVSLRLDTLANIFDFKGDVVLRGGEIRYLTRNFYLQEGRALFNESQGIFDPRITVRGEIRERDENNEQVRILLSAINQPLSSFSATFSSSPPKSEVEVMQLLGRIISADIDNFGDALVTAFDFALQSTVLQKIEDGLRDLLKFDIFTLRAPVLQNVLKNRLASSSRVNELTVGSVLENSSLYIGKYFGSSIYVDALLYLAYDEDKALNETQPTTGIVFQPEFGLEMDSPIVSIRMAFSPEISDTSQIWWSPATLVPATSISLSWKFDF